MNTQTSQLGRVGVTKTVLVFHSCSGPIAFTTDLTARTVERPKSDVVTFLGPVMFDQNARQHITAVILPLVDRIADLLNMPPQGFVISAANVQMTASRDVGVTVSGYSADLPILVAMISALTCIAVSQGVLMTGHVASSEGHLRVVFDMPAKILAAAKQRDVQRLIYPDLNTDISMEVLAPAQKEATLAAIAQARGHTDVMAVRDMADVLPLVFSEEAIIQAAIIRQAEELSCAAGCPEDMPAAVAHHLGHDLSTRFSHVLGAMLHASRVRDARALVFGWISYHLARDRYAHGLGQCLSTIINRLPPLTRQQFVTPSLVSDAVLSRFTEFAGRQDARDLHALYDFQSLSPEESTDRKAFSVVDVDSVLRQISPEHVSREVALPIANARASFTLPSVTVVSSDEFFATLSAFYMQLLAGTHSLEPNADWKDIAPEANALLTAAFVREGGTQHALRLAKTGLQGGLSYVIDRVTEQYKHQRQKAYVDAVLSAAVDPLDWESKVRFVKELLNRCADCLPEELKSEPPERFAGKYEELAKAYTDALSRVRQMAGSI